jgi:glycerol-3-phosphate acyltransferase PlsY
METINLLIYPIIGYFLGSIPSALWITRIFKGIDVRDAGSGHVTTTNTIRQAGWVAGIMVLILDIGKGFLPTFLAYRVGSPDWVVALTGALVVVGHCWPIFAQFRGGMGLAATGGSLLAVSLISFPIALGVLIFLVLIIKHSARAAFFTGLLITPVLFVLGQRGTVLWVSIAAGLVIAVRFTIDWNRKYREVWLDRESDIKKNSGLGD